MGDTVWSHAMAEKGKPGSTESAKMKLLKAAWELALVTTRRLSGLCGGIGTRSVGLIVRVASQAKLWVY